MLTVWGNIYLHEVIPLRSPPLPFFQPTLLDHMAPSSNIARAIHHKVLATCMAMAELLERERERDRRKKELFPAVPLSR